ncbi:MAG: hypothetical protein IJI37_00670 [Opitutales bacterium]|nr:hypothetical protein [Opitutales bacterium]
MKKYLVLVAALPALAFADGLNVSIDTEKTFQKIDNFAASDAWSGNFVGQYFEPAQKERIAKWLFSDKLGADGNPEGIGLSMWRFNIGGGTLEQDGANIEPYQRRAESFLDKDSGVAKRKTKEYKALGKAGLSLSKTREVYDWDKCAGQMYFAKKAKEYGVAKLLLFSNTPLVQYTRNGQGYGVPNDSRANLKPDCYGKFADYMANVAKKFGELGLNVDYISPINEPQVNWDSNRQEGSTWACSEMKKILVELDRALSEKNLDTQIYFGELANLKWAYSEDMRPRWKDIPAEECPNFIIKKFYDPKSKFYVGDLKHMAKLVAGHSYHAHMRNSQMEKIHKAVAEEAAKYGIDYQQSEWSLLPHLTANRMDCFTKDWFSHNRADIQTTLLLARIVYSDFVNGGSTAWGYWKGMEVEGNHALVSVFPRNGRLENGGVAEANKILWGLGNYSFFVRPGFKRVELSGAADLNKVAATAYVSPDGKRVVAVFVNSSFDTDTAKISLPAKYASAKASAFRTDSAMNLGNLRVAESAREFVVAPRSITTIVFDLK